MKNRKIALLLCALMSVTSLYGCSTSNKNNTDVVQATKTEQSTFVKVTNITDKTITAVKGSIETASNTQTPPEKTDNTSTSETPPEKPAANSDGSTSNNTSTMSSFKSSDEVITFTITDSTAITIEMLQGTQSGSIKDITTDSVLEVTLNANNEAEAITVKNLNTGSGFGGSTTVTNGTSATTINIDKSVSNTTYTSTGDDENALRVDGSTVTLDGINVNKTAGNSSNTEDGDFYGQNAGLLAVNGALTTITNATITTSAVNGNGVFSYGQGTVVNISDSTIKTTAKNSGGIQTTGGGTTNAKNLTVETAGDSSAPIRSDRGGGTVIVDGGSYTSNGYGSPTIYSTADISVANSTLTSNNSEALVIEGKNSISLDNCNVTGNMSSDKLSDGENVHNIMIYQSMSGDSQIGHSTFTAKQGSITAKEGDMIYVTNTTCTINLTDVQLNLANNTLLRVSGNNGVRGWGTVGSNGGTCTFVTSNQILNGNIIVDSCSSLDMSLKDNSSFDGAINTDGMTGTVKLTLDSNSKWILTSDSYVTEFSGNLSNVNANGHKLYINGKSAF